MSEAYAVKLRFQITFVSGYNVKILLSRILYKVLYSYRY